MAQTSPQSTDRVSSRQRRIDEQRRKIDTARGESTRRKRLIWLAGIVVVVALAVVVLILMMPKGASASMMRQVTTETGDARRRGVAAELRASPAIVGHALRHAATAAGVPHV